MAVGIMIKSLNLLDKILYVIYLNYTKYDIYNDFIEKLENNLKRCVELCVLKHLSSYSILSHYSIY